HDFLRVAPDVCAVRRQHVPFACELSRRSSREIPMLGVARSDPQCALLAAADADRRMWPLRALGLVTRVLELIEPSVEVRRLVTQQPDEYLAGLLEPVEAFLDGAQFDAV